MNSLPLFVKPVCAAGEQLPGGLLRHSSLIHWVCLGVMLSTTACSSLRESPKYQFVDGIYAAKFASKERAKVFVTIHEDSITGYPVKKQGKTFLVDSTNLFVKDFPAERTVNPQTKATFRKQSLDVDVLTAPIKFRPENGLVGPQLSASINASIFLGRRIDLFSLAYSRDPLGRYKRRLTHFGISYGVFSGLGATPVNPTTTAQQTELEYDGIVWQNGLAMIIGVNNFTLGLALGADQLLDRNRTIWIYQRKPWAGVMFGLNLN